MRVVKLIRRFVAMGIVAMASTSALAQEYYLGDQPQMVTVSAANLAQMSQRLEALEASLGLEDGKGKWEDVSGQKWSHTWGGRVQGDYVMFADQDADSLTKFADIENYTEFRRLRFFVKGEGYGIYDYKMQLDFEPESDTVNGVDDPYVAIKDVYFGINEVPYAGYVRFGHYKAPFSLEELTSANYITFMERALPNVFTPERELGITAYNHSANLNWTWAGGIFVDSFPESLKQLDGDNQGTSLIGRATWTPYYDEPSNGRYLMHLGLSGRWTDDRDDSIRFRSRPEVHEGPYFIDTGAINGDYYSVVTPELAVVWGPFSIQTEYMYVQADDYAAGDRDFHGAYVYGSWFLTGESRPYSRTGGYFSRVKPYTNFWMVRGAGCGTGAVELALRYSYLDLSSTTNANAGQMNDMTLGVNWHWNPYIRWQLNFTRAWNEYDNGAVTNTENDIVGIRGQFDF